MRKKSHISLARYIVKDIDNNDLFEHRKAFYLGSILPDCKPSFITTKHEINGTFPMVSEEIEKLTLLSDNYLYNERVFCRRLGEVIHYLADYFTFPHNSNYDGNLKEHCVYEKELKFGLKEYIKEGKFKNMFTEENKLDSAKDICNFINKMHEQYLSMKRCVKDDCEYIVAMCHRVVEAILRLVMQRKTVLVHCFA